MIYDEEHINFSPNFNFGINGLFYFNYQQLGSFPPVSGNMDYAGGEDMIYAGGENMIYG